MSDGELEDRKVLSDGELEDRKVLSDEEGRKEMFYLTMHSTHLTYGYMASDIW